MNTGERAIDHYMNGYFFYQNSSGLKLDLEGRITSSNTPMGYIVNGEGIDGMCQDFLVLALQNYKSQKNWETQKKQLAHAANKNGMIVIFKYLNEFEDENETELDKKNPYNAFNENYDVCCKNLLNIAKFSQDKDVKTAAVCNTDENKKETLLFSYNQLINGTYIHAEDAICRYLDSCNQEAYTFITLLEPCKDCLEHMIDTGAEQILFTQMHKPKWNSPEFIQATNDIFNKTTLSKRNRPIRYAKINNKRVESFYKKKLSKCMIDTEKCSCLKCRQKLGLEVK